MTTRPVFEFTVYGDDDETVLFSVSTARGHASPYLKQPTTYPEQEVDFAKGAASIGQVTVEVVDVPTDPADQDSGFVTSLLPTDAGYSALTGRRGLLTENIGGGAQTVIDGVIHAVRLLDTFCTYAFELRDIRERERKTRAFTRTDTPTILPRGVLNGYGVLVSGEKHPVPATEPLPGTFSAGGANSGTVTFTGGSGDEALRTLTPEMREALDSVVDVGFATLVFDRLKVLWRAAGSGGPYNELTELLYTAPIFPVSSRIYTTIDGVVQTLRLDNFRSGGVLPSDSQDVEVIVQYDGPVTEDWPLHVQDITAGEFLRNAYRGDYSDEPPLIRYDEAALLALDTPVLGRIKEPTADLRAWAEKHIYPIVHAAPTLDSDWQISPVTYLVPDDVESLPHLSNANTRAIGAGWYQSTEDVVSVVRVKYRREFASAVLEEDPDTVSSREIVAEHQVLESVGIVGERPLEIESDMLTAIGNDDGFPIDGGTPEETGVLVAERVTQMVKDRIALGGQYFDLLATRSDPDVEELRPGSWATVGVSWMPDYATGRRGLSRLAQVVRRRNIDPAWCALTLIDSPDRSAA